MGEHRMAMLPRYPYAVYFIYDEARELVSIRRILRFSQDAGTKL